MFFKIGMLKTADILRKIESESRNKQQIKESSRTSNWHPNEEAVIFCALCKYSNKYPLFWLKIMNADSWKATMFSFHRERQELFFFRTLLQTLCLLGVTISVKSETFELICCKNLHQLARLDWYFCFNNELDISDRL